MITPLYASLLAILFIVLSVLVIRQRRAFQVSIGSAGERDLERAMRVHANFAEYAPFALLLIFFTESLYGSGWIIHVLGGLLVVGRCLHAWGVSQSAENLRFRVFGMTLTFLVLAASAVAILLRYFV
jgi:uncharacterized membrane protein YecN with MAPEG domain